jgi:competence protein ComEC
VASGSPVLIWRFRDERRRQRPHRSGGLMAALLDRPTTDAPDLRLALAAAAAWIVAWQGRLLPPALVGLGSVIVAGVAAYILLRSHTSRAAVVAATCACAAAAGLATAARVHARTHGPLAEAAARTASVAVVGTLVDDPRVVPAKADVLAFQELVVARLRVEVLEVAGRTVHLRQPVLVLAADRRWLRLLPSQRVRVEGRVQQVPRGDDVAALLSARGPPQVLSGPSTVQRLAGRLRQGLREATDPLPGDERGLLPGLVEGDTGRLDPQLRDDFRTTGLTHLTAVSGTNVAVVLGAALVACGWLRVGLRFRPPVAALVLLAFVVLARPSPSVLRAGVMGVIGLVALATGSRRQALPALCAAVLALVLLSPELAAQPGFALSTLATAGLLLLAPVWRQRLARRLPGWLADALAVPAAAQVACTPVVVGISGSLGLLAVPANLLAVPAVAPATVLGVVAALLAPVYLPLAQGAAWLAYVPTWWLATIAHTGARQPGAGTSVSSGWPGALLVLVLMAGLAVILCHRRLRRIAAAGVAGALLACLAVLVVRPPWPPPGWLLVGCDVGQGDTFVVRLAEQSALVVDTGPDPRRVDRCLSRLGIDRVPLLVLTHLHADHVEGVPGLLRGREVGQVEIGPLDEPAIERERLLRWLGERRIPVVRAQLGEVRSSGDVSWEVLDATARHGTDSDPNNSSIVIRLVTHGVSVLFAGDLEGDAQRSLRERGTALAADVLKVPHHGSRKQDPGFLDAVHARVALTPVGAGNPYGHPAASTLSRLEAAGARTYRSDQDGDVAVVLRDGRLSSVGRGGDGVVAAGTATGSHHPAAGVPSAGVGIRSASAGTPPAGVEPAPVLGIPAAALTLCDAVVPDPSARAPPRPRAGARPCGRRCGAESCKHGRVPAPDVLVPLTVVVGEEELLVSRAVSAVVRAARARNPETEVAELDGAAIQPGDLIEVFSPSLFGDERVVVLRGAQDLSKEASAEVQAYAADPVQEICLVALHAGGAKGKAILTALVGAGARRVEAAKVTKASERRDLVRMELRADGRQVAEDAVTALLDAVGNDLRELCSAASQLLSDTDGPVTEEVVARYHRGRAESSGFTIADKAVDGDLAGALELARWGQSTGLAPVLVTSALASTLRSVAMVASAGRRPANQLAAELGMPPWKVEKTQRQARGWQPEALSTALQAVATADGDVKGGASDASYAVERALLAVVQARGGGR